jgi:hypothetical protein
MTNIDPQDPIETRTPRQIAGAANGRLAAGAKSPEGLARSAANSTKHGLTAKMPAKTTAKTSPKSAASKARNGAILFNESEDAFDTLHQYLIDCFLPTDAHEITLVKRMAQAEWLHQRALHMESAALSEAMRQQAHPFHANTGSQVLSKSEAEALRAWHGFSKLGNANPAFANLQRYAVTQARAYARAERELRDYRIAKAESIHPAPPQFGPQPTLEPSPLMGDEESQNRWQPLETREEPTETDEPETPETSEVTEVPENTEAPENTEEPHIPEAPQTEELAKNTNCETKVTPSSDPTTESTQDPAPGATSSPDPQNGSTLSPPPASHL